MELQEFQASGERLTDGTFVVSVAGELDLYTTPELEHALLGANGTRSVVLDLSECTFIDSTALGVLFAAKRRLDATVRFSIIAPAAEIRRPFEVTGLDREFTFLRPLASARNGATE